MNRTEESETQSTREETVEGKFMATYRIRDVKYIHKKTRYKRKTNHDIKALSRHAELTICLKKEAEEQGFVT